MKILLVAGHGGGDSGAVGNGYREADLTREVAARLSDILKSCCDVSVFDIKKNLYQYQKKNGNINFKDYDLVFEIHFNAGGGEGSEILKHINTYTKAVDNNILLNLSDEGFKNRGVKPRKDLYNMNVCYRQGVPCSLLEVCFIDSSNDIKLYEEKKEQIIAAIADGIKKAYGIDEGDDEMTAEERTKFNALVNIVEELKSSRERVYHYFNELPEYAAPTIKKLWDRGIYKGASASDLNLPDTLMRVLVINDRAGLYD